MIKKINMIVLIFLTIFLISTVSATELENKTLTTESTQSEYIHIETNDIEDFVGGFFYDEDYDLRYYNRYY